MRYMEREREVMKKIILTDEEQAQERRANDPDLEAATKAVDWQLMARKGIRQDIPDDIWSELVSTVAKAAVNAALGIKDTDG